MGDDGRGRFPLPVRRAAIRALEGIFCIHRLLHGRCEMCGRRDRLQAARAVRRWSFRHAGGVLTTTLSYRCRICGECASAPAGTRSFDGGWEDVEIRTGGR